MKIERHPYYSDKIQLNAGDLIKLALGGKIEQNALIITASYRIKKPSFLKFALICIAMFLTASLFSQDFNVNPQLGDKGKLKAKIVKVLDENTMIIQSGDRQFKIYADPQLKAFQHSCEAEEITVKYSRTGTVKEGEKNIPLLAFNGIVTKEELDREQAEKVKIQAQEKAKQAQIAQAKIKQDSIKWEEDRKLKLKNSMPSGK